MMYVNSKNCLICAWRANCVKRFSMGVDAGLHCPDFSEDVILRKSNEEASETKRDSDEV
jgi:hypothetical protein